MKLSKTGVLLLAGGVPIILFGSLGMVRSQQTNRQITLAEELNLTSDRLAKFTVKDVLEKKEELESRLSQAVSKTREAKSQISVSMGSVAASDLLLRIAGQYGIEVTEITSAAPARGNLEGITCSTLPVTVRAEGQLSKLLEFIDGLGVDFSAGVVESVQMSMPVGGMPSAAIRLVIYSYQGAGNG